MIKIKKMIIITLITILVLFTYVSYMGLVNEVESLTNNTNELNIEIEKLNKDINILNEEIETVNNKNKSLNSEIKKLKGSKATSRGSSNRKLLGTFEATAYDDSPESQGKWVGKTATPGLKPQVGVIAVDPRVIPLGTKLYVEGYGKCLAGDTGGAIKGHRLDLFFNTKSEVKNWGRKKVKVYKLD